MENQYNSFVANEIAGDVFYSCPYCGFTVDAYGASVYIYCPFCGNRVVTGDYNHEHNSNSDENK